MKKIFNKKNIKYFILTFTAFYILIYLILSFIPQYSWLFEEGIKEGITFNYKYACLLPLSVFVYLILSYDLFIEIIERFKNKDIFNEEFLMVIASIGAFIIGEYPEALAVILLYKIGEEFESYAINKSKKDISSLVKLKSYNARIKVNNEYVIKDINEIKLNEEIYVFAGEKIPLDIILLSNEASIDMKNLTGESIPVDKIKNDEIYSGTINLSNTIKGKVIKENKDSTINRIINLIKESTANKAKPEKFITTFAKFYTPIVILIAFLTIIIGASLNPNFWDTWFYKGCEILVVSCPCSMVISIPLSYMLSIGQASKNGILIKGGNYLDIIRKSDSIIFDKTGTLTKGELYVKELKLVNNYNNLLEFKEIAYNLELNSNHPIAIAIKNYLKNDNLKTLNLDIKEIAGIKIQANDKNNNFYEIGSKKLLSNDELNSLNLTLDSTYVFILKNKELIGYISLKDMYKNNIKEDIKELNNVGFKNMYILSGDNNLIVSTLAKDLNIKHYYSELLPQEKVEKLKEIKKQHKYVTYVGDGINDAPSLSLASLGISMGSIGSEIAIQSSDVSITDDKISKISVLKRISKYNYFIVLLNIIFSILVKISIMILALTIELNLWIAIFADVGMLILCLLFALSIRNIKFNKKHKKKTA